jgi:hypothetical protein
VPRESVHPPDWMTGDVGTEPSMAQHRDGRISRSLEPKELEPGRVRSQHAYHNRSGVAQPLAAPAASSVSSWLDIQLADGDG